MFKIRKYENVYVTIHARKKLSLLIKSCFEYQSFFSKELFLLIGSICKYWSWFKRTLLKKIAEGALKENCITI